MTKLLPILLLLDGVALALVFPLHFAPPLDAGVELLAAAATALFVFWASRFWPSLVIRGRAVVLLAAVLSAVLAYTAAAVWPISGDEYGYRYVADTLLHGRFYNPPPPAPEIFNFAWIATHDGRTASQYPPGWPLILAPFRLLRAEQLANPVLVGVLGLLLSAASKRLGTSDSVRRPLLALVLLSPFTLFNGGSLFNHTLAACCTVAVCYGQIRDDAEPGARHKLLIGLSLALLLTTRHDSFAIVAVLFTLDRLIRRRFGALRDGVVVALGAAPLIAFWLLYNWKITGRPLLTTMLWAFPEEQTFGLGGTAVFVENTAKLLGLLFVFAGLPVTLLYVASLWRKLRSRQVRFYDLLLPATALFFALYPHDAGHQYGPRYWYFAWPAIILTIGPVLSAPEHAARLLGGRRNLGALAGAQLVVFAGFVLAYAVFLRTYAAHRQSVFAVLPPETPAIVLVPKRQFGIGPWQQLWFTALPIDFTRNGLDYDGKVLWARGDGRRFARIACRLAGYTVYRWQDTGRLEPVDCPGVLASPSNSTG